MTTMLAGDRAPDTAATELGRRNAGAVDLLVALGVSVAILAKSIDLPVVGIGEPGETATWLLILQRAAVYVPLAALLATGRGLLRATPVGPLALFLGFTVWTIVGALFTDDPGGELERAVWFAAFALLTVAALERLDWTRFLTLMAGIALVLVAGGLVAHAAGWSTPDRTEFFDGGLFGFERVRGLQRAANPMGRAASFLVLIGAILIPRPDVGRARLLAGAGIVVGIVGLLASQSRFSILGFVVAVTIVAARSFRWARLAAILGVVCGALLVALLLVTGNLGPFSRSDDSTELTTVLGRTQIWDEAIDLAVDNPVFGVGTEQLGEHYEALESAGYADWNARDAHNVVFQTAAAHGVLAAGLIVSTLISGVVWAWRTQDPGMSAIVVTFALLGTVEALLVGDPSVPTAMLIGALGIASPRIADPVHHSDA